MDEVSYVAQDNFLFDESIGGNIRNLARVALNKPWRVASKQ